jgi:hypothetical protein
LFPFSLTLQFSQTHLKASDLLEENWLKQKGNDIANSRRNYIAFTNNVIDGNVMCQLPAIVFSVLGL